MLNALKLVSQGCFEPFFAAALAGWGIWLVFCKDKGKRKVRLGICFGLLVVMILWRAGYPIISGRYALGLYPFVLMGIGLLALPETYPGWLPKRWRCFLAILAVTVFAVIGMVRSVTMQKHQKDFSNLVSFLQKEASKCEAPLFLSLTSEEERLSYYTGLPVKNGVYAPEAEPLIGCAPWLNDRVYSIASIRHAEEPCTIAGIQSREIYRDKAAKMVVYCWENPFFPEPPPSPDEDGGISGKTPVIQEDFESFITVLPGTEWKLLEERGLVITSEGVSASGKLSPNPGHQLVDLHGAEIRVTGGNEDKEAGLILNGEHSFLIDLPNCGGGFTLPQLDGSQEYLASLRFKGAPGSRFRIQYYNSTNPVLYGACREADKVYSLTWKMVGNGNQKFTPVIFVGQGSRIVFDDLGVAELKGNKE